ncbi:MAG TPA: iron-sulfur cluster assembly accessory protein [Alphaproteobacteria bacterium]
MANVIAVTENAATQMKNMLTEQGQGAIGVRVGVAARGCSGLKYFMEYAKEAEQGDEIIEQHGVTILVDPSSVMHMLGTTINYVSSEMEEGFTFDNPNVRSSCGCGESFSTDENNPAGHKH